MEREWLDKGFEQGPAEGGHHVDICRKNDPGKGNSLCKGPEAGLSLACLRNSEEVGESRTE